MKELARGTVLDSAVSRVCRAACLSMLSAEPFGGKSLLVAAVPGDGS